MPQYITDNHLQHDFFCGVSPSISSAVTFFSRETGPLANFGLSVSGLSVFGGLFACSTLAISMKVFSTLVFSLALTCLTATLPQRRRGCLIPSANPVNRSRPLSCRLACCRWRRSWHWSCCYFAPRAASTPWGSECNPIYLKTFIAGEVVTEQDGICAVVVSADDRSEGLLSCLRIEVPAVSQIWSLSSSVPTFTLRNLKSTPMVERRCSSYLPSTNWLRSEDFPLWDMGYRLRNRPPGLACIILLLPESSIFIYSWRKTSMVALGESYGIWIFLESFDRLFFQNQTRFLQRIYIFI